VSDTRPYPLDFDALGKGSVVPVAVIETIAKAQAGTEVYRLEMLRLAKRIEGELAERGERVTVRSDKLALRILTDEEASAYNPRQVRRHLRGAVRSHRRNEAVDRGNLSAETLQGHDRRLVIDGATLAAAGTERRRQFALLAHRRQTPGLPPAEPPTGDEGEKP
jgi:hypothetical protein